MAPCFSPLSRARLLPRAEAPEKCFWKPRGYDFNVLDERKVVEKLDYMHNNPIRRRLVDRPGQWRWSSYRWYDPGDDSFIGMAWDGAFPIVASAADPSPTPSYATGCGTLPLCCAKLGHPAL